MGEHVVSSEHYRKQKRLTILTLVLTTILGVGLLVYGFILKSSIKQANSTTIKCLEEQVRLKEELQKTMRMVEMERYRSDHLEEELRQQRVIAEEAIKRMK